MRMQTARAFRWLVGLTCCAWAATSSAALIVTLDSVTPFGSDFDYHYSITLPSATDLMQGTVQPPCCYFTLYDIPGLVTVEANTGWQAGGGITPAGLTPSDDPALSNVSFRFTGTSLSGPTSVSVGLIRSSYGLIAMGTYAWQNYGQDPFFPESRILFSALGQVGIPSISGSTGGGDNGGGGGTVTVSEPSTSWLLLGGLLLLFAGRRRRYQTMV